MKGEAAEGVEMTFLNRLTAPAQNALTNVA
jgi:hypothetical protein